MNKLTRLTINKFRNVAPTTLEFRPGINVLLGKNAAGKTTLLRLLSTVLDASDEELRDDPLEVTYYAQTDSLSFEHTVSKVRIDDSARISVPGRPTREDFSSLQQTDLLTFKKGGLAVLKAELRPTEIVFDHDGKNIRVARQLFENPIESVFMALLDQRTLSIDSDIVFKILPSALKTAGRMDESLEQFKKLLQIEARTDGERGNWNTGEFPQSLDRAISNTVTEGTTASLSLEFLDRAAISLGYESASAQFDVEHLRSESARKIVQLSNLRFFFKRPGESILHDRLSYGQKRLLSFFAHVDASRDVLIADELVNGLHHEWISACLDEIGERQAFLTSQNPLLLDFLRFESIEEVRHTFIICERAGNTAEAQLIWRNLTEDEAESFFLAYQTGIQRVSDILLTKGLW